MASLIVVALVALVALLAAACSSSSKDHATPTTTAPRPASVKVALALDTAHATTATVGAAGATIGATATDGTEYALQIPKGSLPYAMTSDDGGRLWFVETGAQPNRLVGFDPKTEKFFSVTPIPSGGGTIRYMVFDSKTRMIWFGSDNDTIGRAVVPPVRPNTI